MKKEVIEYMKISDIKPYENNPRIHKQEDIEKIADKQAPKREKQACILLREVIMIEER